MLDITSSSGLLQYYYSYACVKGQSFECQVHGESINRSWCRTTHTSLFALLQTLPVDRAIGAGAFIDVKSYAGALVLCVNFAVICCLLLCIVLLRRVRKPTTGHVKLVTQQPVHGRKEKVRTLSFKLSDLPGEVDVEGGSAAQPKVHVRWEEDPSILEVFFNLN